MADRNNKRGNAEEYISPNRAGMLAGVSGEAVKQWIYGRKLPAVKLPNGYWRIKKSDLQSYLSRRKQPSRMRVLVASTDAAVANATGAAFAQAEFEVVTASNTVDALMKAVDGKPSIMFIDLSEADMHGLDLATKLRATRGFKRLPLVFVASKQDAASADMDGLLKVRAQGMLIKPIVAGDISAEIDKIFPSD